MSEYIERAKVCELCAYKGTGKCKICAVPDTPAADVVEVRHGEWEEVEVEYTCTHSVLTIMRCNKCDRYHTTIYFYGNPTEMMHYCPNCGAKMDGERKGGDE